MRTARRDPPGARIFAHTGRVFATGQWCFALLREARGLPVESAGAWTAGFRGSLLAGRVLLGFLIEWVGPDWQRHLATVTTLAGTVRSRGERRVRGGDPAPRLGVESIAPAIGATAVGFAALHEVLLRTPRRGRR